MTDKKLNPQNFDKAIGGAKEPNLIWTAKKIAAEIGRSPDFVRDKLASMSDSPVKKIGGRYCADRDKLRAYFQV